MSWVTERQLNVEKAVSYLEAFNGDIERASRAADQAGDVLNDGHWWEARQRLGLADDQQGAVHDRAMGRHPVD